METTWATHFKRDRETLESPVEGYGDEGTRGKAESLVAIYPGEEKVERGSG